MAYAGRWIDSVLQTLVFQHACKALEEHKAELEVENKAELEDKAELEAKRAEFLNKVFNYLGDPRGLEALEILKISLGSKPAQENVSEIFYLILFICF